MIATDGMDALPPASSRAKMVMRYVTNTGEVPMEEVGIVGVDLTQQVFQVHGAAADGRFCFARCVFR